jgi:hypothetical protein
LRVAREALGLPDAVAGGVAVSSWLRRGAGSLYNSSCKRLPGVRSWFGELPVDWSGAVDLLGWIHLQVRFLSLLLQLQRLESKKTRRTTSSLNKAAVPDHLEGWICGDGLLPPAGHGGEGSELRIASSFSLQGRFFVELNHVGGIHAHVIF